MELVLDWIKTGGAVGKIDIVQYIVHIYIKAQNVVQ